MIRITKQADYGIVLMTRLAEQEKVRFSAPELAASTSIPLPMVSKILKILVREGLLVSHRGVKGGYTLAREPRNISVANMVEVLDGPIAFTECIEDSPGECSQESVCGVRENWQRINLAVRQALDGISLADLNLPSSAPLIQLGGRKTALPAT